MSNPFAQAEPHGRRSPRCGIWSGGPTRNAVPDLVARLTIFGAVFVIGFWTWKGQTPGKMLFKMRIIKKDGSPIGLRDSILRFVGQILAIALCFLGFLMIAWDGRKQGLHDKIAGTYVVRI